MNQLFTVDFVGDEMVVRDEDGNDFDRYRLVGLRAAKRQLRLWRNDCTFDYPRTLAALEEFFSVMMQGVR